MATINDYSSGSGAPAVVRKEWINPQNINIYQYMADCYKGTGGFRDGTYLIPHWIETDEAYEERKWASFYRNYFSPIIHAMINPVFDEQAERNYEGTTDLLDIFVGDADNEGNTLQGIVYDIEKGCAVHGVVFVVVDNFSADYMKDYDTRQKALDNRIMPYVYLQEADKLVVDEQWSSCDKYGRIEKISFWLPNKTEKGIDSIGREKLYTYKYLRTWDNQQSAIYRIREDKIGTKDEKWELVEESVHGLGVVPVAAHYYDRRNNKKQLLVDPPLYDIARINWLMYNKDSWIIELEKKQGFSIFYTQGMGGNIGVGTNNFIDLPTEASIPPGFASPNPALEKNQIDFQDQLREELYRIAQQSGVNGVTDESGVSKQWDFRALESVLRHTARRAENIEYWIVEIFKLYTGDVFEYDVIYKDDFAPNRVESELKELQIYLDNSPSVKGRALAMSCMAQLVFRDKDANEVAEVVDEEKQNAVDLYQLSIEAGQYEGQEDTNTGSDTAV